MALCLNALVTTARSLRFWTALNRNCVPQGRASKKAQQPAQPAAARAATRGAVKLCARCGVTSKDQLLLLA